MKVRWVKVVCCLVYKLLIYLSQIIRLMNLVSMFSIAGLSFAALFMIQTALFSNIEVQGTVMNPTNDAAAGNENTGLASSGNLLSSSSSSASSASSIHINAKNTQEAIYNCATGEKGVIIPPGNVKIIADKKGGKWTGSVSIIGATGEKSGLINSGNSKGSTHSFKGNLNTKNTLCHFPGLQMGGTAFEIGTFNCGTVKNVAYKELSTGNTNTFKVRIDCR